jgi:DNA topoisomerase-1
MRRSSTRFRRAATSEGQGAALIPEDKGRLVTAFLVNYFRRYVEYDYTATLEGELDDVSAGDKHYKDVLERFWKDFSAAVAETSELRITDVLEKINEVLEPHLFPPNAEGTTLGSAPIAARAAVDAHGALRRGVHRLLELSRMPLYPPLRPAGRGGRWRADGLGPDGKMLGVDPDSRNRCT